MARAEGLGAVCAQLKTSGTVALSFLTAVAMTMPFLDVCIVGTCLA